MTGRCPQHHRSPQGGGSKTHHLAQSAATGQGGPAGTEEPQAPRPLGLFVPAATTAATATATAATAAATAATAAPACCTAMALLRVLTFDHEGRPVQFDTWLDDLQLYLLSDSKDSVSLFDLASGAAPAPPVRMLFATRSLWLTYDAAACLAVRNHLPLAKRARFGQHKTSKAMYDAVVARYSSPATAALRRLILPYLFPELSAFATLEDLVTHLYTSDARYYGTIPAEFLDRNPLAMYITLYFIVTRLPDSLRAIRDHFLALDPTYLTVDLLEKHLLAAETSVVAVGVTCGTPRTPFFEGCSPSHLAPSYASAAAVDILGAEDVGAASALSGKCRISKGKGGKSGGGGSGGGGGGGSGGGGGGKGGGSGGSGGGSGGFGGGGGGSDGGGGGGGSGRGSGDSGGGRGGAVQRGGSGGGQRQQQQQRRSETPTPQQLREWFSERGAFRGSVRCPYVIRTGDCAGQTCGKFQHRCFSRLDDAWRAEFVDKAERPRWSEQLRYGVDIFALDYDAILAAMYALSVSAEGDCYLYVPPDPGIEAAALGASEFALPSTTPAEALHNFTLDSVLARSSTILPCPAVPSGSLSGLHLPSFSTNLVSTAALQDAMVTTTTPWGQRVSICTCIRTGRHLATLTRRPGLSLYTLTAEPPQVAASNQVSASGPVAAPFSSLPPLPPSPTPPCLPCVEGRQRAAPHSSSFPLTSAPLQTLQMDVWGPARVSGQGRERYFLLVVDDYTRYTTVFPLHNKGEVLDVLIPWIRAVRLQFREQSREDLPILRLHSDRGGEFSSDLLRDFCRGEAILQSFMLPASPQQNGFAERRIGLVMEVARTSMIHGASPHFLWPFAVWYVGDQLNLWPHISLPETSPTLNWTGKVGDASVFRGPAPTGVSQVDPRPGTVPVEVAVDSGATRGAASGGAKHASAEPKGAEPEGAESGGGEPGGAEPGGTEPEGAKFEGAESGGAEPRGTASAGGPAVVCSSHTPVGAGGSPAGGTGAGGAGATSPRGARTRGTRVAGAGGVENSEAGDPGAGGTGARGAGAGGAGAGDPGAGGSCAGDAGAGGTGAGGAGASSPGGAGVTTGARGTGGAGADGPGGARTKGTGAAGAGGVGGIGAGDPGAGGAGAGGAGARDSGIGGTRAGGTGAGGTGAGGAGAGDPGTGGAGAGGAAHPEMHHLLLELADVQRYVGLQITRDRAARTITLTESHMVEQILTQLCFPFSKVQLTPLAVDHGLTAPPSNKPFESSDPYPEMVGCLMYLMTCTRLDLAYPLSVLARFVAPGRHRPSHWYAAKRTSGMGLVLGGKQPVTLTGFSNSLWANGAESLRSTKGYCFSLGTGADSWRLTWASSVSSSSCEAEVYTAAMAAQELCWLSFLLTDLGERPRSPPVLFADNRFAILMCEEP
ncbi:unnamed protein product [Closterium sp. NIES-54]